MAINKLSLVCLALVLLVAFHNGVFVAAADSVVAPGSAEGSGGRGAGAVAVKPDSRTTLEKYLISSGGFIADDLQVYGKVVSAPAPGSDRMLFGRNDYVYLDISQDNADQYTDFFIVDIGDYVRHPRTGKKLGRLFSIIGKLRIVGQEAGYRKALITESSKEILVNQPIVPAYAYEGPEDSGTLKPNIGGVIVKVLQAHLLGAQYEIIYVDKGTDDGLRAGDMFTVMSTTKPVSPIGKIQILSTQKNTSTAYVMESKTTIYVGDTF
ncbi:MAG: hypothetical protein L7F77_16240 [Candidatus Magnetominusculus sp. LBB02]|nr:hypothetical protein [Candidatus Magnetominusculus sp. LBB02]